MCQCRTLTTTQTFRFDLRQLLTDGDHWITGGALAICALAAGHVTQAAAALGQLRQLHQVLTPARWCCGAWQWCGCSR